MENKRRYWLMVLLFASFLTLAGCYGGDKKATKDGKMDTGGGEKAESGQVLNLSVEGEIPTLRTNGTMDGLSQTIIQNIFEGLFRLNENDEIIEGVVDSYEVSKDGKKYTFQLKEDAVWSNGDPVKADDFVYAWRRNLAPETISPHAYLMNAVKGAEEIQNSKSDLYGKTDQLGVKAIDASTLEVELVNSVPYFTELLAHAVFYPQHEEFVESKGDQYALEPEHLIFNGPFQLDSWDHDQKWTLKKNSSYWDEENVKVEEIRYNVAKDMATSVNLYETGAIDAVNLSSDFVDAYKDHAEFTTSLKSEVYFLRMNQKNQYLQNVNIRKAIDMAWDKEQAADSILKNGSKAAYWLVFPGFVQSEGGEDFREKFGDLNKGDLKEAQALWKKGLEELGTKDISLELLSYDDEQRKSIAEYMKNQLEKNLPGLSISINQQPNKQKLALEEAQDYDLSHSGWRNDVSDPVEFLSVFLSDGPYNWQDFNNEKYDSLVKKAMSDFSDIQQRFEELQEAEKLLIGQEAAISPMYQAGSARLIKPYVKGYVAHANSTASFQWVSVEK
ncbi:peptide ABC transporter substrate-binding protein [Siminovitchia sp. FSL W7-1587]|uniref:peptide ABC transporter substrate-binding protein n=1 Tax=Siminovitchia sp. FSL W7-1587 TaxID=2954699 RepID=UPI0030CC7A22